MAHATFSPGRIGNPMRISSNIRPSRQILRAATAAACLIAAAGPAMAATYTLTPIAIPGSSETSVIGITQSGLYYGFYKTAANSDVHLYTQSGSALATYDLGTPGFADFHANNSGDVVGDEVLGPNHYRFSIRAGHFRLHEVFGGIVIALDDRGDTVARNIHNGNGHFYGVQHLAGKPPTTIHEAGATNTIVDAMNDEGIVVGAYQLRHDGGTVGFTYAGGQITAVQPDGLAESEVVAINNPGVLAVQGYDGTPSPPAYFGAGSAFTHLSVPGAIVTNVLGLNDSDAAFGTFQAADQKYYVYVYKAGTYTVLPPPKGATTIAPAGMDAAGNLVGTGQQNGKARAFYAACSGSGC
jgi:hypothetical protein